MPANSSHLEDVINAVRARIVSLDPLFGGIDVEVGNPAQFHPRADGSKPLVTIFVYRIEPDNAAMLATPDSAAAMRLHTLITVFCTEGLEEAESTGSLELRILSHIIRLFHENNKLGPVRIREAAPIGPIAALVTSDLTVEAQQMAPDMEEINHIWTTQADAPYRTSVVYKFSFGIITPSQPSDVGPPVLTTNFGDPDHPEFDDIGVTPFLADLVEEEIPPALGVLTINIGSAASPQFVPAIAVEEDTGPINFNLVAVTETAENLDLTLERFDQQSGLWVDISAQLSLNSITSLARTVLQDGGNITNTAATIDEQTEPQVLRIQAQRNIDPETLQISPVFITAEEAP
jgi:hypothetical protein